MRQEEPEDEGVRMSEDVAMRMAERAGDLDHALRVQTAIVGPVGLVDQMQRSYASLEKPLCWVSCRAVAALVTLGACPVVTFLRRAD